MPNSPSAKKALRQNLDRRARNRSQRSAVRTSVKKVRKLAARKDEQGAREAFRLASRKLDRAGTKKLIHKNTAARTKSRLAALLRRTFPGESSGV